MNDDFKKEEKEIAVIKELSIVNIADVMEAADRIQKIKQIGERITERKEEITKPMNEALKSARALFKPVETMIEQAESELKAQVLSWHQSEWLRGENTPNTIEGSSGKVTVTGRKAVNIVDKKKLPKEYWILTPNVEMIEAALKAGTEVKGAELVENYSITSSKI